MKYLSIIPLLSALFIVPLAHGEFYKWTDASGEVHYSDEATGSRAKKMGELPGLSTYNPPPIQVPVPEKKKATNVSSPEPGNIPDTNSEEPAVKLQDLGYSEISLIQPEIEGTIWSNEGNVNIFVALSPVLKKNHYFKVTVDGKTLKQKYDSTVIRLQGVDRGEHSLEVAVVDGSGKQQISTRPLKFYLRKRIAPRKSSS